MTVTLKEGSGGGQTRFEQMRREEKSRPNGIGEKKRNGGDEEGTNGKTMDGSREEEKVWRPGEERKWGASGDADTYYLPWVHITHTEAG